MEEIKKAKLKDLIQDDRNLNKGINGHDNIAWDSYEEDYPFTNEPKRKH